MRRTPLTAPLATPVTASLTALLTALLLTATACGGDAPDRTAGDRSAAVAPSSASSPSGPPTPAASPSSPTASPSPTPTDPELPQGGRTVFPAYRVVAYYGSAGGGTLGVLGEASPDRIVPRLRRAAAPFATPDRKVQIAFELIVTVADARPGKDGDYNHDIGADKVQRYLDAARRHRALLILDLQPGRSDFLTVARRYERFLTQPDVGIALDPEWRVAPGQVPGRTIGRVRAAEVNRVSSWVADLVRVHRLPQKLFLLHQFRTSMLPDVAAIRGRPGLALIQHVDGFGSRSEKDATYARVGRPQQFHLGYKLFYDEDVRRYAPAEVLGFRPRPEYVSYQ